MVSSFLPYYYANNYCNTHTLHVILGMLLFLVNMTWLLTSVRMRSEGYSSRSVCLAVRLSVDSYSGTTRYEAVHERYQRLQNNANPKTKMAIFLKRLRSRYMA